MNIAYLVTSLKNSGPVVVVNDLVKMMVANGHYCVVYYFKDIVELGFPCETKLLSLSSSIPFKDFDVVHCHGFRPDLFVLLHKPLFCKAKVFSTIHSYMFQDHKFKYGFFKSRIYPRLIFASQMRSYRIIVLSKDAMSYYSKYISSKKLTYAYNSRICDFSQDLTKEEKEEFETFRGKSRNMILSCCGLSPLKGLDNIIQALKEIPDSKYCIVGDGVARKELGEQAYELGVSDRVLFVGYKKAGFRYLKYADIYAMPSRSEGFPLALLEAAAYGKACVVSDIPVFKEIFTDEEVSMFELGNEKSVVRAINRAIENKELLSNNIKEKFDTCYSPTQFYERHLEIYNQLR